MASIHEEVTIDADPAAVWEALRDWGALHERLAPGFVVHTELDGTDRIVTFGTGSVLRERHITTDEATRRLVWSVVDDPYTHHNGSAQALPADGGRTRFVWIADLLPDAAAPRTAELMRQGLAVIRQTLEARSVRP
ncbi:SRPBCC family protein [Dactylosporangium salmoneum]|uniref:Polyketide cyclase/dehydrase/lipid transport protein n=1 Tax=Dactylosporangium salmoneum TaxID=53361 RepID=A0ABP5SM80_9ACTN